MLSSLQLVYVLLNIAGSDQRQEDLFSAESLLAKGRSALKGLKVNILILCCPDICSSCAQGVENVYMQHTPHLSQTIENLLRGRLKEVNFPFIDGAGVNAGLQRPQDVMIFMVGGTTYEEARTIALLNQESTSSGSYAAGTRLLLGGTCIHNSSR